MKMLKCTLLLICAVLGASSESKDTAEFGLLNRHLKQGKTIELRSPSQMAALAQLASPTLVAFVNKDCGFCKSLVPVWEEAASNGKGKLLFATIDMDNEDMQETLQQMQPVGTPEAWLFRQGEVPAKISHPLTAESLSSIIDRVSYEYIKMLKNEEDVEAFIGEASLAPADNITRAHFLVRVQDKQHRDSVMSALEYAKAQAFTFIKVGVCQAEDDICGLETGAMRVIRHDLPPMVVKQGHDTFTNLADQRATHIFLRSSQLQVFSNLHPKVALHSQLALVEAATVPVVFVVDSVEAPEYMVTMAWKYLGRAVVMAVPPGLEHHFKWGRGLEADEDKVGLVFVCKFASSHVCYRMKDKLSHDALAGSKQVRLLLEDYFNNKLDFTPLSEEPSLYTHKHVPPLLTWVVSRQLNEWITNSSALTRIVLLTHDKCDKCDAATEGMTQFANEHKDSALRRVVQLAAMDCTRNDPPASIEIHSFPAFFVFPAGSDQPLKATFSEVQMVMKDAVLALSKEEL